jgi:hypothetical protein
LWRLAFSCEQHLTLAARRRSEMPLFEYVLVALMGAAGHPAAAPGTILGPEAIAQPNGGALVSQDNPPKKEDSRRHAMLKHRRHHKHRHGGRKVYAPRKEGSRS